MRKALLVLSVLLALTIMVLGGCGGGSGDGTTHGPRPHGDRGACINCHSWTS